MSPPPSRHILAALFSCACLLLASHRAFPFSLLGHTWSAGSDIVMHLSLNRPSGGFQDGSGSWNASAADALQIWNQHLQTVRFVQAGSVPQRDGDGLNSVFFSSTVYGESFGKNVIAVTVGYVDDGTARETDVIFNSALRWNSYRGPIQTDSRGVPTYDLHRVALHEFGHVLGLDHPDQNGQSVSALMNSQTDDNDNITDDDVAGARQLYGRPDAPGGGFGALLRTFNIQADRLVADPNRPRVYATMGTSNSVAVIDTESLSVIKTVPIGEKPFGLSVSADGTKLWVANRGSASAAVGVLDLNTLEPLAALAAPQPAYDVEEGLHGMLYTSAPEYPAYLIRLDSRTGAAASFGWMADHTGFLEVTRDRRTLFFGEQGGGTLEKFDISGNAPVQVKYRSNVSDNSSDLTISNDGDYLLFPGRGGTPGLGYRTAKVSTFDLTASPGAFDTGPYPGPVALSGDDAAVYIAVQHLNKILAFDAHSFAGTGSVDIGSNYGFDNGDLTLDRTGAYLFLAVNNYAGAGELRVYATGRTNTRKVLRPAGKTLVNVSTRLRTEAGDDALIGGFIITGDEPKTVAVRAIGPSLPVTGRLEDPTVALHDANGVIATNDDWTSNRAAITDAGLAPTDDREAVVIATAHPGAFTVVVRGASTEGGIALVEVYDLTAANSARLANLSTRGKVELGDQVMIGGFIIGGDQPTRVIIRALGPSLMSSGVAGALEDTTLDVHDGNGTLLATNDDWRHEQESEISATSIAPGDDRESATVQTLQPGSYTAVVRGKAETTGVALVEVYNLDAN